MSNKVVFNDDYGGFSLSPVAERLLRNLGYHGSPYFIPRHDSRLIRVVEHLGNAASGEGASLAIASIGGRLYKIDDYDGDERVVEPGDIKWIRIP